jgi:histidinol-phosphate aminotransferase
MDGYTPGEQPNSLDVVKLNTNENPYPPAAPIMEALQKVTAESLRRYPPPNSKGFREAAAKFHDVDPAQIILTNGGDELLRLLITTFVEPGALVGMADPSYSLYPVLSAIQDAKTLEVPLNDDWTMPPNFAETMNAAGVNLTFVVNPHAPSGRLMPVAELEKLAQDLKGVLCIDEAYVNFVEPALGHSTVELVKKYDNVVILRSFSKGYSLAGLRCGYGIGSLNLVEPMQDKTKDSYNMNYVSQVVSTAALVHWEESAKTWEKVIQERARVTKELEALGWEVIPSSSNFVLATVPASFNGGAANVYAELKAQEILVRYFAKIERLQDKLRCTIGTPDENSKFLDALKKMK